MTDWAGAPVARTERLQLRTFRSDDLPPFAALNADPEVYAWLGGSPIARQESDAIAAWAQQLYASEGIGLLAVERLADQRFLGMCGLHHQRSFPDDVEVAWRLARSYWGRGYATEAAAEWLRIGFEDLEFSRIISITEPVNARSLAVMRRLGMTFDHQARILDEETEFDAHVYAITAGTWRARRSNR